MVRLARIRLMFVGVFVTLNAWAKDHDRKTSLTKMTLSTAGDSLVGLWATTKTKASVFIFLSPECPVCQQYTKSLEVLANRYASAGIAFYGVIPGTFYSKSEVAAFSQTYKLSFPLLMDGHYDLTHLLNASITPEVIVVDSTGNTRYSGAIDNAYRSVGRKNAHTPELYLERALIAITDYKDITIKRTIPIGCLVEGIQKRKDE